MSLCLPAPALGDVLPGLTHFSARPLRSVVSLPQRAPESYYDKPRGLWVSVEAAGEGWSAWCRSEKFGLDCFAWETVVQLHPAARVLVLRCPADLDDFTERFGRPLRDFPRSHPPAINWPQVEREYQAILIVPYIWKRRLHHVCSWYYGWDCASGCIWDADAVASLSSKPCRVLLDEVQP